MKQTALYKVLWVFGVMAITTLAVFFVDQVREPVYKAEAKYMVVVKSDSSEKANNYSQKTLGNHYAVLTAELINTDSFVKEVFNQTGFIYESDRLEEYRNLIKAEVRGDTEIVNLKVRNSNPEKASMLAKASLDQLQSELRSSDWAKDDIDIQIMDEPITPDKPFSPNFFQDLAIAYSVVFLGVVIFKVFI